MCKQLFTWIVRGGGILFIFAVFFLLSVSVQAADMGVADISPISRGTELDPAYAFSFNNARSGFSMSTRVNQFWACPAGQEAIHGGNYFGCVIQESERSVATDGRIWFKWHNIGTYRGIALDLKCTLVGVGGQIPSVGAAISFCADNVGWIQINRFYAPTFRFTFLNHATGELVSVKGHGTLFDLDGLQGVRLSAGFQDAYYIGSNGWFSVNSQSVIYGKAALTTNEDSVSWVTATFDGPYFDVTFYCDATQPLSWYVNTCPNANVGGGNALFGFVSDSIGPFGSPLVEKTVDETVVADMESWTYQIFSQIANEDAEHRFSSLVFTDTIPSCLDIQEVHIYDITNGVSYDSYFTITTTNNVVRASAISPTNARFYGRELMLEISVKPNLLKDWSGYDHTAFGTDMANSCTLTTNRGSKVSNTVHTYVWSSIAIKTVNGTHVESAASGGLFTKNFEEEGYTFYKIGTGDTFSYEGHPKEKHLLSSVSFNGVVKDISSVGSPWDYVSTVTNVTGMDNKVLITYDPYWTITTEVVHGTISDSIPVVKTGENKTITYSADSGYYLESVAVDGSAVNFTSYVSSYTFSNVSADHVIKVVYAPYWKVTTEATNGMITPQINNIKNGENKTVTYSPNSGYYLEFVTVDGSGVDINTYPSSYTFSNIAADHDIQVVFAPYWKITTEVVNGTITPEDTTIKKGENRTVSYQPKSLDYYLKFVEVDSKVLTVSELLSHMSSYSFSNISADHHVKVVYAKVPVITITKRIEGEVIWKKGSPEFLYRITGTDYLGNKRTYHRSLVFSEGDGLVKTVALKIPAGVWTVSEYSLNDWRLDRVQAGTSCVVSGKAGVLDTRNVDTASVTFVNSVSDWSDYTENDTEVNQLK